MNEVDGSSVKTLAHASDSLVLKDTSGGNKVVNPLGTNLVIKFGGGVTRGEAEAQRYALGKLDPTIIRVPKVYGFYYDEKKDVGYLTMEFINDGLVMDEHNPAHVEALHKGLSHLASIKRDFPGPLHSGEPQGILWEDDIPSDYSTIAGIEQWISMWLNRRVDIGDEDLVLCHLDTVLENMLWVRSGQLCLLDWASAGYYPRYFELAAHLRKGRPSGFVANILRSPPVPYSDKENERMCLLIQACANSMRYARPGPPNTPPPERNYLKKQPSMPSFHQVQDGGSLAQGVAVASSTDTSKRLDWNLTGQSRRLL